jgi:hypothetical protein
MALFVAFVLVLVLGIHFFELVLAACDYAQVAKRIEDAKDQIVEREVSENVLDEGVCQVAADFPGDLLLFFRETFLADLELAVMAVIVFMVMIVMMAMVMVVRHGAGYLL